MEVSALRYSGGIGLHGRSPLLRLQSDERLISMVRRGNTSAFEVLVSRYHSRLLAFCRHLLGSREDAEDILQEVFAAAFNAMLADDRAINVRPWLYRIARNRSLNHLRRSQAIGVDSMDVHFSENGLSTADKVHDREQFRLLVGDIHDLPETQRTALVLREMDALSYEQIAEAMDTTVPGVKSLLVRARISLAEAAEARLLTCEDVRVELAEVAEGLRKRPGPLVRRHVRTCRRCSSFQSQLKRTNRALAALLPIGPLALLRQFAIVHLGHSAGTGSGATAAGATGATGAGACSTATGAAAGQAACVAGTAGGTALGGAGGVISAGAGAIATKAAGALAAAAIVTAGAVEATHTVHHPARPIASVQQAPLAPDAAARPVPVPDHHLLVITHRRTVKARPAALKRSGKTTAHPLVKPSTDAATKAKAAANKTPGRRDTKTTDPGRVQTETDPTVLASPATSPSTGTTGTTGASGTTTAAPASSSDATTGSSSATTGPTGPSGTSTTGSSAPTSPAPPTDTAGGAQTDPANGTQTDGQATSTGPTGADGTTTTTPGTSPGAADLAPIS